MSDAIPVTDQIVLLLRVEGPLTMSKISSRLGRNPGGIRQRLLRMVRSGRLVESEGPGGWTIYSVPNDTSKEGTAG